MTAKRTRAQATTPALKRAFRNINDFLVCDGHLKRHAKRRKTVSEATKRERMNAWKRTFCDLHALGFYVEKPELLRQEHIRALAQLWEALDIGPSQNQKVLSVLRVTAR